MTPTKPNQLEYDIVIVGGGLVGASMAVALEHTGLAVAVVEPQAADSSAHPSFDERTVALTYTARQIYSDLGLWEEIAPQAQRIREIHVSERGRFGMTHLSHRDVGTEALGYVVPTRVIGAVLHGCIERSATIALHCPAKVVRVAPAPNNFAEQWIDINYDSDSSRSGKSSTLRARLAAPLVIIADGGRSALTAGARAATEYPQRAIISIVQTDRDHRARAYERFTPEGPLALLPHSDMRYALVWTTSSEQVAARMALSDEAFIAALQTAFGDRAGNFARPSARKCYPLSHGITAQPMGIRTVTIGNAAHVVHPVAGQGFNLGLRDVAVLGSVIERAHQQQRDIGSPAVLEEYAAARRRETAMVSGFTDGLIRLFGDQRATVGFARNLALMAVELCPPAKRFLLRRTMGMARVTHRQNLGHRQNFSAESRNRRA